MRLRELQAALTGYIAGDSSVDTILPFVRDQGPASAVERLALYASTLRSRAAHRLSRAFPHTALLLGPRRLKRRRPTTSPASRPRLRRGATCSGPGRLSCVRPLRGKGVPMSATSPRWSWRAATWRTRRTRTPRR